METLLGGVQQLNPLNARLADWKSAAFLFQLTNDELPALAVGQASLLDGGSVPAWQVKTSSFWHRT